MSARGAVSRALAVMLLSAGCAAKPAPVASALAGATVSAPSHGAERAPCPRVERATRMWVGFLVDVPSEAMVRALDAVVPIQSALSELFCAQERADCRPTELQAIDLTDERANVAQLRVQLAGSDGARALSLTLQAENETWSAQPESLDRYLALCRERASDQSKRAVPRASK